MLDIEKVIEDKEALKQSIINRNIDLEVEVVDQLIETHLELKSEKGKLDDLRRRSNELARQIPEESDNQHKQELIEEGKELKKQIQQEKTNVSSLEEAFQEKALQLPNFMDPDTPKGLKDSENVVLSEHLSPPEFDFQPQDHISLGTSLDLIDFQAGARVAGPKFYYLKNEAVLLELALQQFALKRAIEKGYSPVITPDLAKESILQGSGFAPRGKESNIYRIEGHDLNLIATSEITVGGLFSGERLQEDELPKRIVALSHCFRTEAGAGGQASKGLYRVHQFNKVELYVVSAPYGSDDMLNELVDIQAGIYQDLEIPYRLVRICSGDLGAPAYKKFDIEAWMPGKGFNGDYGEITSAGNFTDYQARRLNICYRSLENKKNHYVHTLNGTAVALTRTLLAIMENHQTAAGGIRIPEVLQPYMGMTEISPKQR
jgi:seryl-tRNA synthetase